MEIEAKFRADGELLERLNDASEVAGWPVAERSRLRLETVYYDTVDRRLAEHDCALRLRRGEPEGTLLSFKRGRVAGEISRREESEVVVPADYDPARPASRPQPLLMTEAVACGRPLGPILTLSMDRAVLVVMAGDSRLHICLDRMSRPDVVVPEDFDPARPASRPQPLLMTEAVACGRPLGPILTLTMDRAVLVVLAGDSRLHICLDRMSRPDVPDWRDCEIEVELDSGPETGLAEFVTALQRGYDLKPSGSSKIERAMRASID